MDDAYWIANESSADPSADSRPRDYWHQTIREESPDGALAELERRHTWLRAELSTRATRLADQLAEQDTPDLRTKLFERAEYLAGLFGQDHARQLERQLAWLITQRRGAAEDADMLAEVRAGRLVEVLVRLSVEDITELLTEYHGQLRDRAEQQTAWQTSILDSIERVARDQERD
jgi:hypothetical protein